MNIDWDKYMHLVRDASLSPLQVARKIGCSRDSVYRVRKLHGIENNYIKNDAKPTYNYLADMRAGFPRDIRQNENLSRYMQGNCDDLPSMRISRGHMGRE
jgi:hypothetical protein